MNEDALRRTLETGRTWFWSRSRQEYWCKGETSGDRQYVREALYDCDVDVLLFVVEQEGRGACHTGERSCFFRAFGERRHARPRLSPRMTERVRPSRDEFVALARDYTVVPVWREVLADLETPVSAFVKLGRRRARASCSSRSSTPSAGAGSRSSAAIRRSRSSRAGSTVEVRRRRRPPGVPTDRGALAALEALLAARTARRQLAELPPFHGGIVG